MFDELQVSTSVGHAGERDEEDGRATGTCQENDGIRKR